MIKMDLKGVTWVANLYEKFEAMCLEVEENMYQDTVKYVENQVQTVGASVKSFYSDVMQDLSPSAIDFVKTQTVGASVKLTYSDAQDLSLSSIDPAKPKARDLSLEQQDDIDIYKKLEHKVKDVVSKANVRQSTQVSSKINHMVKGVGYPLSCSGVCRLTYPSSLPSGECAKGKCCDLNLGKDNDGGVRILSDVGMAENPRNERSPPSETSGLVKSLLPYLRTASNLDVAVDQIETISPFSEVRIKECASEEGVICSEIDSATKGIAEDELCLVETPEMKGAEMRLSFNDGLSVEIKGPYEDVIQCAEEMLTSHLDFAGRLEDGDSDANESGMETVKLLDEFEVEESCIIVDASKSCFVSQKDGKHRSYKKKIREAFSTKKKPTRKQEYEQLALKYGEIDMGSNLQSAGNSTSKLGIVPRRERFLVQDLCESDWELL